MTTPQYSTNPNKLIYSPGTTVAVDLEHAVVTGRAIGTGWGVRDGKHSPYVLIELDNPQWTADRVQFVSVIVAHPSSVQQTYPADMTVVP